MKKYEKPIAEIIDFAAEAIMDGTTGETPGSLEEGFGKED